MNENLSATRAIHPWVTEGKDKIRFAVVGDPLPTWSQQVEFVQQCEELGFDAYWANDHPNRALGCWTMLTGLAVATKKIRLISLVTCIYYHHPILIARMAADVDRLSDGRLVLGIGIGDDTQEFEQFNIPFPPTRQRQEALEEAIPLIQGLWGNQPFTFQGKYFQVTAANISPRPVQNPYVPILLAGGGERVTLRQVAQYADMSNFGPHEWAGNAFGLAAIQRKLDLLRRYCEAQGRPYESVLRSHYSPLVVLAETQSALQAKRAKVGRNLREHYESFTGTPPEAVAYFQALVAAGMQYFMVVTSRNDLETVRLLAEQVMPELKPGRIS